MILDNHYAVVFKPVGAPRLQDQKILTHNEWRDLQELSAQGHFVILEAWDITKGKCVIN